MQARNASNTHAGKQASLPALTEVKVQLSWCSKCFSFSYLLLSHPVNMEAASAAAALSLAQPSTPLSNQVAGHQGVMSDASGSLVIKVSSG